MHFSPKQWMSSALLWLDGIIRQKIDRELCGKTSFQLSMQKYRTILYPSRHTFTGRSHSSPSSLSPSFLGIHATVLLKSVSFGTVLVYPRRDCPSLTTPSLDSKMSSPRSLSSRNVTQSLQHSTSHPVLRSPHSLSSDSFSKFPSSPRKPSSHMVISPLAQNKKTIPLSKRKSDEPIHVDVKLAKSPVKLDPIPSSPRKAISRPGAKVTPRTNDSQNDISHLRPVTATRNTGQVSSKGLQVKQIYPGPPSPKAGLGALVTQVKVKSYGKEDASATYKEHVLLMYHALRFVQTLPAVDPAQLTSKRISLPKRPGWLKKKTLIFDLDETLVHCCEDQPPSTADVALPITFPTGEVVMVLDTQAGINIRPYVRECLITANLDFEVMVFTASHRCYADVVLDHLDPDRSLIHHRLYRDNCVMVGGVYIKDLRVLANRNLEEVAIVDNAAYSFAFQLDNGIPIISWKEDKTDRELMHLVEYLKKLASVPDVRVMNTKTFHLRTFVQDYSLQGGEVRKIVSPRGDSSKPGKLSIH